MAIPDVDIPINTVRVPMEWIMRAERAVEKVRERLLRTARALEQADIPYAVVGGNAVAVWVGSKDEGAVRNTKDVDVLLERRELPNAVAAMGQAGFMHEEVHGVSMFLEREDPMPSRAVHLVFANEKVKPNDLAPAPPVKVGIRSPDGVDALDLPELLTMKLIAFRRIDQVHIIDLLRVDLIGPDWVQRVPEVLRSRLEEILANPDG